MDVVSLRSSSPSQVDPKPINEMSPIISNPMSSNRVDLNIQERTLIEEEKVSKRFKLDLNQEDGGDENGALPHTNPVLSSCTDEIEDYGPFQLPCVTKSCTDQSEPQSQHPCVPQSCTPNTEDYGPKPCADQSEPQSQPPCVLQPCTPNSEDYGPFPPPCVTKPCTDQNEPEPQASCVIQPCTPDNQCPFSPFLKRENIAISHPIRFHSPELKPRINPIFVFGQGKLPPSLSGCQQPSKYQERLHAASISQPTGNLDNHVLTSPNPFSIPITHEVFLRGHTKAVSALDIELGGTRLATGGHDFNLRFWDFPSMTPSLQPFRSLEPCGHYMIHSLQWHSVYDKLLLGSSSPQAKILDREGRTLVEFAKGHQYNLDMAHTSGHIKNMIKAIWHPTVVDQLLTSSMDGTIRLWSVDRPDSHLNLIKIRNARGMANQCRIYGLDVDHSGQKLILASDDGSIQMFNTKGPYHRPIIRIDLAHTLGSETSCVSYHPTSDHFVLSRGGDDTLKIWDLRTPKIPLHVFSNLPNHYQETNIAYSPDVNLFVTPTSTTREGLSSELVFYNAHTFEEVYRISACDQSVLHVIWPRLTNEILVACANGSVKCFFNPKWSSSQGIQSCLKRRIKGTEGEVRYGVDIDTPMWNSYTKSYTHNGGDSDQRSKRKDPILSHKPLEPVIGSGSQGRLGTSLKTQFMKRILKESQFNPHEDPREALLKHAGKDTIKNSVFDYQALENLNQLEIKRAQALAKYKQERDRK